LKLKNGKTITYGTPISEDLKKEIYKTYEYKNNKVKDNIIWDLHITGKEKSSGEGATFNATSNSAIANTFVSKGVKTRKSNKEITDEFGDQFINRKDVL
jgi:hypothetical protein